MSYEADSPRRRGSGCGLRLIIAIMILIGGFASYYLSTQKNPVTNEVQHVKLTPDQEVRLGLESAPEMTAQMGGEIPPQDPRTRQVAATGRTLAAALPPN